MFCCKKQGVGTGVIVLHLLVLGVAGAAFAACRIMKKCRCGGNKTLFSDLGLCFDGEEKDVDFGCIVPDTNNDVRSDENAVVNSEGRTINTPNPLMD